MKKIKTIFLTSLTSVLLLICLLFSSCGTAGKYDFESLEVAGKTYEIGDIYSGEELTDDYMSIRLKSNGTAITFIDGKALAAGSWVEEGDEIIITIEGDSQVFKKDGKKLTATIYGQKITLSK